LKADAGNATHFVVFDACRNTLKLTQAGSRAIVQSKGFVPVAHENGMLIAYATAEGELASDVGTGAGPYARVLAEEIVKPQSFLHCRRVDTPCLNSSNAATPRLMRARPYWVGSMPRGLRSRRRSPIACSRSAIAFEIAGWDAINRSSGYAALDQAAMEMLQRAQPFPPPPAEMSGETFKFAVPIIWTAPPAR
jgi:hypothetical protein